MSPRAVVTRARGTPGHRWPGQGCSGGDTPAGEEKSDSGPGHSGDKGKGEDPGIDAGSPEGGKETPGVEDKGMGEGGEGGESDKGNEGDDKVDGKEADWLTTESDADPLEPEPQADGDKGDKDHEKTTAP